MRHVGTSPGIWDDSREAVGSNTNGKWRKLPDGAIEQTGTITTTAGAGTITFPLAFPTGCDHVALTPVLSGAGTNASASAFLASAPTKTQAVVASRSISSLTTSAGAFSVAWRAIGS